MKSRTKKIITLILGLIIVINIAILYYGRDSNMKRLYNDEIARYTGYDHMVAEDYSFLDRLDKDDFKTIIVNEANIGIYPDEDHFIDKDILKMMDKLEGRIDGKDYYVFSTKNQRGDFSTVIISFISKDIVKTRTHLLMKFAQTFSRSNQELRAYMTFFTVILSNIFLISFLLNVLLDE